MTQSMWRSHRYVPAWVLALSLAGCFGPGTAQEGALEKSRELPSDAGADPTVFDASDDDASDDEPSAVDCAAIADIVERLTCRAEEDGRSFEDVIREVLGGGEEMECAGGNPVSQLLCGFIGGGGGLEGLLDELLGGGGLGNPLADGGVERILIGALAEVIRGILDDLATALFEGVRPNRDGGIGRGRRDDGELGRPRGGRGSAAIADSSLTHCESVSEDDLAGRIACARLAVDQLEQQTRPGN